MPSIEREVVGQENKVGAEQISALLLDQSSGIETLGARRERLDDLRARPMRTALADLVELDESKVRLTPPVPVLSSGKNPYPRVHTLNSTAHLEAIDCISPMMRNRLRRAG